MKSAGCRGFCLTVFPATLMLWAGVASAAESNEGTATQESEPVSSEQGDQNLLEYIERPTEAPMGSVRFDRETPVFGVRWGWTLLYDTPLNIQPDGASATLRLAKLHFFKQLGTNWDVRINVNYNTSGQFELGKTTLNTPVGRQAQ